MCVCVYMCHVVNLCQLCVAVPLTSDHRVRASADCCLRDGGPSDRQELGPLSAITPIKQPSATTDLQQASFPLLCTE